VSSKYNAATSVITKAREGRAVIAGLGFGGSQISLFLTYALLFWYGAGLILDDEINFKQLMTAIMSLMLGTFGLGTAMSDMGDQKAGMQAAVRIFRSIDEAKGDPLVSW
ncbi:Abcb1, partial [Symbiodinium microadriaticum]